MLTGIFVILGWMGCAQPETERDLSFGTGVKIEVPVVLKDTAVHVDPKMDSLPENGLDLWVTYPEPIRLDGQNIRITDMDGRILVGSVPTWTWDEPRRTVHLQPSGLNEGQRFMLVVHAMTSDSGQKWPAFSKAYTVRGTDNLPPDGAKIAVSGTPAEGSKDPVLVVFNEPVRAASLKALAVLAGGRPVLGTWTLGPHQTRARFSPEGLWPKDQVFVSVGAGVQDLAGNGLINIPRRLLTPMVAVSGPSAKSQPGTP
jgi:hypothetical protein